MITTKWEETADSNGWLIRHNFGVPNPDQAQFKIEGDTILKKFSKLNENFLYLEWRLKMEKILTIWCPPEFDFTSDGFKVKFIRGKDLHGNNVLEYDSGLSGIDYDDKYLLSIQGIYKKIDEFAMKLGITFTDVNESNIIIDPNSDQAFLVDFDNIGPLTLESITNKHRDRIQKWK